MVNLLQQFSRKMIKRSKKQSPITSSLSWIKLSQSSPRTNGFVETKSLLVISGLAQCTPTKPATVKTTKRFKRCGVLCLRAIQTSKDLEKISRKRMQDG
jgi:hypothetical protein